MGRYGDPDKKGTEFLIKSACNYIDSLIKDYDGSEESKDSILGEIESLRETFYDEGDILSDTLRVRYEKRINKLENKIMKRG